VSGDQVLAAVERASSSKRAASQPQSAAGGEQVQHRSLVQTNSAAQAQGQVAAKGPGEDGDGEDFGPCKTCVFVLERIKKGSNMLLPAICSELYHKYPDAYALCHQVLNALSINGNNVRYWLFEGCFKYEIYQSKEWIKPCPSHVMCSVLKDLSGEPVRGVVKQFQHRGARVHDDAGDRLHHTAGGRFCAAPTAAADAAAVSSSVRAEEKCAGKRSVRAWRGHV
jgi:hypothetical protein